VAEINVPKLNNNDQTYTLLEWLAGDGCAVEPDEAIATIETSKAAEELVCAEGGVLWHSVPAGAECEPGEAIGWVVAPGTPRPARPPAGPSDGAEADGPVITRPAQALMDERGVGLDQVRELDRTLVRAADIERLAPAGNGDAGPVHHLPAVQGAVARTVQRSHQDIPAAYSVMKVHVDAVQEEARQLGMRLRKPVGMPEFLIAALAPLHSRFPVFFATPAGENTVRLADDANIGLTMDAGEGLFVPVIKRASTLSLEEIVELVGAFRISASRGSFREEELSDGHISIALNNGPDVVMAIPLIFPGQICSLALADALPEVILDDEGNAATRTVTNLGLAYDHRFVNGGEAAQFLRAVKDALESPGGRLA
jgi:2-oxoglutarate dehydrogenase E2 component (dihydrolipoamide succinyltransferase)